MLSQASSQWIDGNYLPWKHRKRILGYQEPERACGSRFGSLANELLTGLSCRLVVRLLCHKYEEDEVEGGAPPAFCGEATLTSSRRQVA